MKYYRVTDGEWFEPEQQNHKLACCDCGLVHTINFRIKKGNVQMQATRNKRSTALIRRHKKIKIVDIT
jgi:hypothetical protein